jgi:hypothetical protein
LRNRKDGREFRAPARKKKSITDGFELKEFACDLLKMGKDHQFPPERLVKITAPT